LLQVFDFGDLEEFQQYFSMLDIDNSGDLSPNEIRILLKTLHLEVWQTLACTSAHTHIRFMHCATDEH
jgi:Ca2+-binding EF-hand superfamily protein